MASRADVVAVRRGDSGGIIDVADDTLLRGGDALILVGAPGHVEDAVDVLTRAQG